MNFINQKNNKFLNYGLFFLLFISCVTTHIICELYFFTPNGTSDYGKYVKYLSFFQYKTEFTGSGQGLIYYYLVSFISFLRRGSGSNLNEINFINSNIHLTNFTIYIIGLLGFYFLLKKYKFHKVSIYLSLTLLNFCMPIFIMRSQLKPEILAFGLLPWILIGLENYFEEPSLRNILIPLFPTIIVLNTKGSITGMIAMLLLLKFVKKLRKNFRIHLVSFLILSFSFLLFFNESQNVNGYSVVEHDISNELQYDNSANLEFLTNINKWDFYYFPIYPYHNNSAIGITLLDTYGDYFNVYTDYDEHLFYYEKKDLFFSNLKDDDQFYFGQFFPEYFSIIFAFLFYISALFYSFKEKKFIVYFTSPLIGIFILTLNSFGIPFNNFNPLVGDTMKTTYYSFLTGLAFVFLIATVFKKINILKLIIFAMLPAIFFVSLGFPKEDTKKIDFYLEDKMQISLFCPFISIINDNIETSDCFNAQDKFCEYNILSNDIQIISDTELKELKINAENPIIFLDKNSKSYKVSSINECKNQILQDQKIYNPQFENLRPLPPINLLFLIFSIFSILSILKKHKN